MPMRKQHLYLKSVATLILTYAWFALFPLKAIAELRDCRKLAAPDLSKLTSSRPYIDPDVKNIVAVNGVDFFLGNDLMKTTFNAKSDIYKPSRLSHCKLNTNGTYLSWLPGTKGWVPAGPLVYDYELLNHGDMRGFNRAGLAVLDNDVLKICDLIDEPLPLASNYFSNGKELITTQMNQAVKTTLATIHRKCSIPGHSVKHFMGGLSLVIDNGKLVTEDQLVKSQRHSPGMRTNVFGYSNHIIIAIHNEKTYVIHARGDGGDLQKMLCNAGFDYAARLDAGGNYYFKELEPNKDHCAHRNSCYLDLLFY